MKKLIEKRASLKAEIQAMLDKVKNEERAFNEDEAKEFDRIEGEIKSLDATIAAEERAKNISDIRIPEYGTDDTDIKAKEERAFRDFITGKITEMRAGEQDITMSANGAVIPKTIAQRIIDAVVDICPILAGADVYHVKGTLALPKWTKANTSHDVSVGYKSEFSEISADSGKFISVDLGGYLAGALVLVGMSVENNAAVNVVDFVIGKIAEKVAEFIEGELLTGTGSDAAQGALNCSNTVAAAATTAITLDELIKLQSAVKQVYQKNACWTMNPETFAAVKMLKDTTGRPLLETDSSKEFPYMILGKPVYLSDNMPKLAAGNKTVLYGDYTGLSVNFREDISVRILREKYITKHAIGVISWFEFDSKITDEQKLAVLVQKSAS